MDGKQYSSKLYDPLPKSAGGEDARPVAAALSGLLPYPYGARQFGEEQLRSDLQYKSVLLDTAAPRKREKPAKLQQTKGRSAAGKITIPKAEQKYDIYVPLMNLWKSYAESVVGNEPQKTAGDRILRMDLHGAPVRVVRSKDPGLVGVEGILIAETANTIIVVVKANRTLTVPKNVSIISVQFEKFSVELNLQGIRMRASERSAKKIKKKYFRPM